MCVCVRVCVLSISAGHRYCNRHQSGLTYWSELRLADDLSCLGHKLKINSSAPALIPVAAISGCFLTGRRHVTLSVSVSLPQ